MITDTITIKCAICETEFNCLQTSKYDVLKLCESCINSSIHVAHLNRIASNGITPSSYLNGRPVLKYDDIINLYNSLNISVSGKCVICGSQTDGNFFDSRDSLGKIGARSEHLRVAICNKCMSSNCDRIAVINDKHIIESAMPLSVYKEKATDLAYNSYAYEPDVGD